LKDERKYIKRSQYTDCFKTSVYTNKACVGDHRSLGEIVTNNAQTVHVHRKVLCYMFLLTKTILDLSAVTRFFPDRHVLVQVV